MTVWGCLAACRRWWVVLAIGLVASAGVAGILVRQPGVYFSQTNVVFLAPATSRLPNTLQSSSETLIDTAGLVYHEVERGVDPGALLSAKVTLADVGVRDGTLVRLVNSGGQWESNFDQPVLDVEAVGSDSGVVHDRMAALLNEIQVALSDMQDRAGVAAANRISIQPSPSEIDVVPVSGSTRRAAGVALALGLGLSVAFVLAIDRRWPPGAGFNGVRARRRLERRKDPGTAPGRELKPVSKTV